METIKPSRMTILFVGHDAYFEWTEMVISHFEGLPYPKVHLGHTKPVNQQGVVDVLAPHFLESDDGNPYHRAGKDIWVDRMIEGLSNISTRYVWFVQSDHMYVNTPTTSVVENDLLKCMDDWNLDALKLHTHASYGDNPDHAQTIHENGKLNIKYSGGSHYPISHHGTIFRTEWLLESLKVVKDAGLISAHDHELYFFVGGGGPAMGQVKLKYREEDDKPWRVGETIGSGVELISTIATGRLRQEAIDYLTNYCTHPNRLLYEGKEVGYDVLSGNK